MKIFKAVLAAASCAYVAPAALAVVIDFEGLAAGTIVDNDIPGITVVASGPAVIFDTLNPTGGDTDLVVDGAGNVLILHERVSECDALSCTDPDDDVNGGTLRFEFDIEVFLESLDVIDIESDEAGGAITLFGAGGVALGGPFFLPDTGGDNTMGTVLFNVAGVEAIEIDVTGSMAFDNLTFTPVPIPGALLLMLGALAPLPFLRRG